MKFEFMPDSTLRLALSLDRNLGEFPIRDLREEDLEQLENNIKEWLVEHGVISSPLFVLVSFIRGLDHDYPFCLNDIRHIYGTLYSEGMIVRVHDMLKKNPEAFLAYRDEDLPEGYYRRK